MIGDMAFRLWIMAVAGAVIFLFLVVITGIIPALMGAYR